MNLLSTCVSSENISSFQSGKLSHALGMCLKRFSFHPLSQNSYRNNADVVSRCRSRGWVAVNNPADSSVEMAYKKVGDGHPLRLWRVSTEVEAPPNELLHRVLRERHVWDPQLLISRLVKSLDKNVEVFQYATGNMNPLPARDYCVVR